MLPIDKNLGELDYYIIFYIYLLCIYIIYYEHCIYNILYYLKYIIYLCKHIIKKQLPIYPIAKGFRVIGYLLPSIYLPWVNKNIFRLYHQIQFIYLIFYINTLKTTELVIILCWKLYLLKIKLLIDMAVNILKYSYRSLAVLTEQKNKR